MPGVPWHTQILADQLTLVQPGGTDYAHLITTGTPGFSDLTTALNRHVRNYLTLPSYPPILLQKNDKTLITLFAKR